MLQPDEIQPAVEEYWCVCVCVLGGRNVIQVVYRGCIVMSMTQCNTCIVRMCAFFLSAASSDVEMLSADRKLFR